MKKMIVGLSVNAEIVFSYDGTSNQPKNKLLSFKIHLSGTSGNVATALHQFGHETQLIGMVGIDGSAEDKLLESLVQHEFDFRKLPVLDKSSIALLPIDNVNEPRIVGRRGAVIRNLIPQTIKELEAVSGTWKIATGTLPDEVELAIALLGNNKGYRSLNPNKLLCQSKLPLIAILKYADLLILSTDEYRNVKETLHLKNPSDIHSYGPTLVIVTDEDRPGWYSLRGNLGRFEPKVFTDKPFPVGAGDWFHSSFISKCEDLRTKEARSTCHHSVCKGTNL